MRSVIRRPIRRAIVAHNMGDSFPKRQDDCEKTPFPQRLRLLSYIEHLAFWSLSDSIRPQTLTAVIASSAGLDRLWTLASPSGSSIWRSAAFTLNSASDRPYFQICSGRERSGGVRGGLLSSLDERTGECLTDG